MFDSGEWSRRVFCCAVLLWTRVKPSSLGGTIRVQLSTRFHDYIVDALALRSAIPELNRVCSDPRVVKVLHGCDKDVIWLQRDFGVYLVNVFDTGQAARVLQFPSFGLLHLLQSYCGVIPDKALQVRRVQCVRLCSAFAEPCACGHCCLICHVCRKLTGASDPCHLP